MTTQEIADKLKSQFGDAILEVKIEGVVSPFIKISPGAFHDIAVMLYDDEELKFNYLMCLSGVDFGKNVLGIVYHLFSMAKRHKLTIRVDAPSEKPEIPSVTDVWPGANWHEREAYDMIGIKFSGHPDLRRILLPEDWDGYPLRKDYKVSEFYHGMKVPY